jgi:hypothetical protein
MSIINDSHPNLTHPNMTHPTIKSVTHPGPLRREPAGDAGVSSASGFIFPPLRSRIRSDVSADRTHGRVEFRGREWAGGEILS